MLLGGNALVAQVQGDLQHELEADGDGDTTTTVDEDQPPLTLNNMRLPADLLAKLPPGATLDPEDLSKLKLPEGMDIELPEGFDLSDLDFDLPSDFDLELPAGTRFDPSTGNLSLPNGGRIRLPDGQTIQLPPGTNLTLPREVVDQLLAKGLPSGTLPRDATFRLEDLPPGLNVGMDPPGMPGNSTLRLPPGTQLRLPDGTRVPPEALAGLIPFLLPEGTEIVAPPGYDGEWPLPQPDRSRPPTNRTQERPPVDPGIAVATDIDTMPSRIAKAQPFFVEGYVRERESGRDVAGAPVLIYMNETKDRAGVLVGQGTSGADGRFRIEVELPAEKPAGQWQLVNHAAAFTAASGARYADGWGDPPIETFASTSWNIDVPARDGLQTATPIRGTLIDDVGAPVPLARVEVLVDGVVARQGATATDGTFSTTYVFTTKGAHTVQLRFPGNAYYEPSESDERSILIEEVAIDVPSAHRVERGSSLTLTGRILISGVATPGREVVVDHPFGATNLRLVTDSGGRFAATVDVPMDAPLGEHSIRYHLAEYGMTKSQRVDVWTHARLLLDAPPRARLDLGVTPGVLLVDPDGNAIPGQSLLLTLAGPGGATEARELTGLKASRPTLAPPRPNAGEYVLTVSVPDNAHVEVDAAQAQVVMGLLEVDWDLPETVVRGRDASVTATLRFAGEPLARERVGLALFGPWVAETDANGRASWSVGVPPEVGLGRASATLEVPAYAHSAQGATRVVAIPKLVLGVPEEYVPGEPVELNLTLRDDLDAPLAGHTVQLALRAAGWSRNLTVTTGADGAWSGVVETQATAREELAVAAHHPETGNHLAAEDSAAVFLAASVAGTPNLSPLLWGVPLVAVGLAGGAGVLARRRLRARAGAGAIAAAAPVAAVVHAPGFDLDLGIPSGEPLVWGRGDPLDVTVTPTGASVGRGSVRLAGGGVDRTLPLEPGQTQRATLRFEEEGDITLTATRTDDALAAPVSIGLRVAEYHKEISREFDLLLERARLVDKAIDKQSTPQEVEWMLGHRLGAAAAEPLAEMALVMDIANYSETSIGRAEYLRFVRAVRALDPMLPRGGPA